VGLTSDAPLLRLGESTAEAVERVLETVCAGARRDGGVTVGHGVDQAAEDAVAGLSFPAVAAEVSYVDGVSGGNLFLLALDGARGLAAAMMGDEAGASQAGAELSELELSAVGEAMNQMMSAAAVATARLIGKEVEIAPPEIHQFTDAAEAVRTYDTTPYAITSQFWILGEACRLVQFIPNAFVVRMNRALSELTTEYTSEHTDAPLSHSVRDIPLRLWAELGRVRMPLSDLVGLPPGAVVELDREVEHPIDLYVDDMPFATGRLLVTDDAEWAVRVETVHGLPEHSPNPETEPSTTTQGG
jgi:flagellar motor switch protein FliN/FliY